MVSSPRFCRLRSVTSDDVVVRKDVRDADARARRPQLVFGRHLRGHVDLVPGFANHLPDKLLAVPVAISQGGVDEIQAQFDGVAQRIERLRVIAAQPLGSADAPRAITDLADVKSRSAQLAVVHDKLL